MRLALTGQLQSDSPARASQLILAFCWYSSQERILLFMLFTAKRLDEEVSAFSVYLSLCSDASPCGRQPQAGPMCTSRHSTRGPTFPRSPRAAGRTWCAAGGITDRSEPIAGTVTAGKALFEQPSSGAWLDHLSFRNTRNVCLR